MSSKTSKPDEPRSRAVTISGWSVIGVGVAIFGLGLAADLLDASHGRAGGKPSGLGYWLPHFGIAVITTGWWILKAYPKWVRDTQRPAGLPPRNDLSRSQHPALFAMTLVVPALGALVALLALGILVGWPVGSPNSTVQDRIVLALGGVLTWIVAIYVLVASRRVWPRDASERDGADGEVARSADQTLSRATRPQENHAFGEAISHVMKRLSALFAVTAMLAGLVLVLGLVGTIAEMRARSLGIPIALGSSMIVACIYAWQLAHELRPRDKFGRDVTLKTYTDKEPYDSLRKRVLGDSAKLARKGTAP